MSANGNRVILVKQGETLIVAVETTEFYERSMGTIGAWFKAIGIDVLFVNGGNVTIGKTPFHPCERGNEMGECVLQNGHENIGGSGPGVPPPGPAHIDRTGQSWGVAAG